MKKLRKNKKLSKNKVVNTPLTSTTSQHSSHWLGLMDPTNVPIRDPVIINDFRLAPYTYDKSSVESAFNHGELKPFGIQTEQSFKERVMPRQLVMDLNKYIIENLNNQDLEKATEKPNLDEVYFSPISHSFPLDEKNTSSYICTVDGYTYSKLESNGLLRGKKISPINREPINVQNFFEDKIAKKLFDHYQVISDQKISNQEFSKILFEEFNGWNELLPEERKNFFIEVISIKNIYKLKKEIILALSVMSFHSFINPNFSAMRILSIIDSYLLTRIFVKLFRANFTFKFILRCVPFLLSNIIIKTDNSTSTEIFYHLFCFIRAFFLKDHLFFSGEIRNSFNRIYQKNSKCVRTASVIGSVYLIYNVLSADYTRFFIDKIQYLYTLQTGSLLIQILPPEFQSMLYVPAKLFLNILLFGNDSMRDISLKIVSFSYLTDQMTLKTPSTKNIALIPSVKYSSWIKKAHFLFAILVGVVYFFFSFLNQQNNLGSSFLVGMERLLWGLLPLAFGSMMVGDESENNKYRLLPRPHLGSDSKNESRERSNPAKVWCQSR